MSSRRLRLVVGGLLLITGLCLLVAGILQLMMGMLLLVTPILLLVGLTLYSKPVVGFVCCSSEWILEQGAKMLRVKGWKS
jgi:hypothetical protein